MDNIIELLTSCIDPVVIIDVDNVVLCCLETEVQQNQHSSKTVNIEGRQGTYAESITVIDRYKARPDHLEDICLAQFAISYVYASKVPKKTVFDGDGCSEEFSDEKIFEVEVSNSRISRGFSNHV